MTLTSKHCPIHRQPDGNYIIHVDGNPYGVCGSDPSERYTIEMVEAYLADHPEALTPEPVPPPPTPEQLAEQRRQAILAELDAIDRKRIRPLAEGEADRVASLNAQAQALRAELASL